MIVNAEEGMMSQQKSGGTGGWIFTLVIVALAIGFAILVYNQ